MAFMLVLLFFSIASVSLSNANYGYIVTRIDDFRTVNKDNRVSVDHQGSLFLLQYHLKNNIPLSLGLIPGQTSLSDPMVPLIEKGVNSGIFDVEAHGFIHIHYGEHSRSVQFKHMIAAKNSIAEMFGVEPIAFFPPYTSENSDTIGLAKKAGYKVYSNLITNGIGDIGGIYSLPPTVGLAGPATDSSGNYLGSEMVDIAKVKKQTITSIHKYGYAIWLLHPLDMMVVEDGELKPQISQENFRIYIMEIKWAMRNCQIINLKQLYEIYSNNPIIYTQNMELATNQILEKENHIDKSYSMNKNSII